MLAKSLTAKGVTPNAISAFSVVAAAGGGLAFLAAGNGSLDWKGGWLAGAACIQLRLICNLMDGMVAIEGGKKSPTGDLWNELPDRFADTILLACAAWAVGSPWVGALAAWASVMTAYVRASGAALVGTHDFCGPFAKPQRMAALTVAALVTAAEPLWKGHGQVMKIAIMIIAAGTCVTIIRRVMRLSAKLKEARP
ncbi:CDP-alcohol phosphatidyltransferase family protein [Luteolibacter arcticus]|uniref:CDP-alcohol phosphatidyltransferase family protein n=1 Tax=Luteolibacter arcticus TaxID=1581411 RepID=A0ABT3GLE3_9BACT|nr:CDP-alcohol phosphatidyltransferase family protein [Luteolibacter arcticus]MCW1924340.1 CDP-alcohol phosphatidyltransferase family protein [Luteolibacter arcticus]